MSQSEQILPWHQPYWQLLAAYSKQQRIPQALLIKGQQGLGKQLLGYQFAQALLCEKPRDTGLFCNQCLSCNLFKAQTHPDYLLLQPEQQGKSITIGQVRALISSLTLKPHFAARRVIIIDSAEDMSIAAANGFLKCLEEPAERTVIILLSGNTATIPATIISRCQKMHIEFPQRQMAVDWLKRQQTQGDLQALLNLAQGSPLLAVQYAEQGILQLRKNCFSMWLQVARQQITPVAVAKEWQEMSNMPIVDWIITWTMDLIQYRYHIESIHSYNPDFADSLKELAQKLELKCLYYFYSQLLELKSRLDTQLNKQLIFEDLLINWSQLTHSNQHYGRISL